MVSLKTQIAGFPFDNCLMNAAGVSCMTVEELEEVRQSSAGTFITKTATLTPRQGNPEPRYRDVPLGSINSMGLPNQGIDYYLDYLLTLQESQPERTFFLSLVGLSPGETHILRPLQNSPKSPKFLLRHLGDFGEFCKGLHWCATFRNHTCRNDVALSFITKR